MAAALTGERSGLNHRCVQLTAPISPLARTAGPARARRLPSATPWATMSSSAASNRRLTSRMSAAHASWRLATWDRFSSR